MKIQRLYESTCTGKNNFANRIHYKINKVIVNLLYPMTPVHKCGIDEKHNVIVSLTSYPARIGTVHLTLKSLLNQTYRPGAVILWLSKDQFPNELADLPEKLTDLQRNGLSIRFCENIYPHKKYYYTMLENPDTSVITVDDDALYPENLVYNLVETSKSFPDAVCCYWAHRFIPNESNPDQSCSLWEPENEGYEPAHTIIPTGVGGVLYPPHSLADEVFNLEAIRECALRTDDLWLKAMALLAGTKAVRVHLPAKIPFSIIKTQKNGLYYENVKNNNNNSWNKLMERYPSCKETLMKEYRKICD